MDNLCGKWHLESSENFDAFMCKLGVGWAMRMVGNEVKPMVEIVKHNGGYKIITHSTFKTTELQFQLNKEIDETTMDGRLVKTTFSMDGNKLVQTQKATKHGEKDSEIIRYVEGDKMITKLQCEEVECIRTYRRE